MTTYKSFKRSVLGVTAATIACLTAIASAPAYATIENENFEVVSLTNTNPFQLNDLDQGLTGDDGGSIALTGTGVLVKGDSSSYWFDKTTPAASGAVALSITNDQARALFTDLSDESAWFFTMDLSGGEPIYQSITKLNDDGTASSTVATLSEPITLSRERGVVVANGWGRVGIWDTDIDVLYDIDLPSGDVTTITGVNPLSTWGDFTPADTNESDVKGSLGIFEYHDGTYSIVTPTYDDTQDDSQTIDRFVLNADFVARDTVYTYPNGTVDSSTITISCSTGRWYGYAESGQVLTTDYASETLYVADASCEHAPSSQNNSGGGSLAATGSNTGALLPIGLLLALGGALVVARRREAVASK